MKIIFLIIKSLLLLFCISFSFSSVRGQNNDAWEKIHINRREWTSTGDISFKLISDGFSINSTLSMQQFDNPYDSERNELYRKSCNSGIVLNLSKKGEQFDISFNIQNNIYIKSYDYIWDNQRKKFTHIWNFVCWVLEIVYIDDVGNYKTNKNWVIRQSGNPNYEYDIDSEPLGRVYSNKVRTIKIYNNDQDVLVINIDDINLGQIKNVKSIKSIGIKVSPGINLDITNITVRKKTIYGQALPYLNKAVEYLNNNNPSAAASEVTKAINNNLKCYETYMMRGVIYYEQGYFKSAIEDLSSAINYTANDKELAYYYRGLSKLATGDDYGVDDLRKGGQNGLVYLRENNLMNYTPGKNNSSKPTKTGTSNNKPSSKPTKPALTK